MMIDSWSQGECSCIFSGLYLLCPASSYPTTVYTMLSKHIPPCPPCLNLKLSCLCVIYHAKMCHAITYTMPCPQGHTVNLPYLAGPYDILYIMPDSPYHAITHQTITNAMPHLARPIHIYHVMPTRPYHAMPARPYHAMPAGPYHIPCHAHQTIPHTSQSAMPHYIPSHISPGNTIYHDMPARQYHISCQAIPCHALQTIPYTKSCHRAKLYTMPCR